MPDLRLRKREIWKEILFASSDRHILNANGYLRSCAAQERAQIPDRLRVWAPRAKTLAHAYAMHMLVRHHICAHVSRRILTLEIASSVRAAYKALWHVAVALADLGAACTVHIGYACAPCTLAMHVPTDTQPQHVKTMNVLAKYPIQKPSHRYCAPRETSRGAVWVTK